ncbi:MAG: hypothetical protein AAGD25_22625 [Cyanobacteria bacterium P01_F01_bin.150]
MVLDRPSTQETRSPSNIHLIKKRSPLYLRNAIALQYLLHNKRSPLHSRNTTPSNIHLIKSDRLSTQQMRLFLNIYLIKSDRLSI